MQFFDHNLKTIIDMKKQFYEEHHLHKILCLENNRYLISKILNSIICDYALLNLILQV